MSYTCTKTFDCVSTAHRNWRAKNNTNRDSKKCSFIHGYTKSFTFVFGCDELDENNWVYDYGTTSSNMPRTMTLIKEFINDHLDHGVTTDSSDPMLSKLYEMHDLELIKLFVIPDEDGQSGSVEGLCRYFFNRFNPILKDETNGRVWIQSVTISEHHKNSSTFHKPSVSPVSVLTIEEIHKIQDSVQTEKAQPKESFEDTKKAFEQFESKTETKAESDSFFNKQLKDEIMDKVFTKDNLTTALKLLKMHPKYAIIATALLNADDVKDAVLKNPIILDLIKGILIKK